MIWLLLTSKNNVIRSGYPALFVWLRIFLYTQPTIVLLHVLNYDSALAHLPEQRHPLQIGMKPQTATFLNTSFRRQGAGEDHLRPSTSPLRTLMVQRRCYKRPRYAVSGSTVMLHLPAAPRRPQRNVAHAGRAIAVDASGSHTRLKHRV